MTTPATTSSAIVMLLMDELRQSLEPKVSNLLADYQLYKETHEAILQIPFVKSLLEQQRMCKCSAPNANDEQKHEDEQMQLEIIDISPVDAPNLDSIEEYINSTVSEADEQRESAEEEEEPEQSEYAEEEEEEEEEPEQSEAAEEEEEEEEEPEQSEAAEEEEKEEPEQSEAAEEEDKEEPEQSEVDEQREAAEEEEEEEPEQSEAAKKKEPEAAEQSESEQSEEEELELFEVEIKGKTYVTNDETNGDIYEYDNDEVGEIVGAFKNGVAKMIKKSKSSQKK
jgi:outer membrane biosynthesis protein TonB